MYNQKNDCRKNGRSVCVRVRVCVRVCARVSKRKADWGISVDKTRGIIK